MYTSGQEKKKVLQLQKQLVTSAVLDLSQYKHNLGQKYAGS